MTLDVARVQADFPILKRQVHVRVRLAVQAVHRVEHGDGLLRARRGVEVGERLPVDRLLEDGEIAAQRVRIELRTHGYGHGSIVPAAPFQDASSA